MPIRIREIHIKATISQEEIKSVSSGSTSAEGLDLQRIVAICTDQIMRRLKAKMER